jgi:anti-sigma regulatory factor (Ser/Thr protein kinase)
VAMAASQPVPSTATVLFPYTSASVRSARHRLAADLRRRGVPPAIVEDSLLVVSEILSNALQHARPRRSGKVEVSWDVQDGAVEIQVADGGGPTRPYHQAPSLSSLGGRGLSIVASIAANWGVQHDESGTIVWATLLFGRYGASRRPDGRSVGGSVGRSAGQSAGR